MTSPDMVLYHANCSDGFCAAWLVHQVYPDAEFIPVQYGQEPPEVAGKNVWIVDFSYKRDVLLSMKEKAKSMLVLDHHKTAKEDLAGLDFCTFDMDKSGARLTFEHLHYSLIAEPCWLVDYTEDRDLWRHKLPHTKEINAALRCYPMDFAVWDELNKGHWSELIKQGEAILRYQEKVIEAHVANAKQIEMMGHQVMSVNCTCADLISEIAGELAKGQPFGVCWFEGDDNERVYSLRSRDGGVDVSEIAKIHGGGGHRNAAGFRVPAMGATGVFSQGKIDEHDEGELKIALAADKEYGLVRIEFGKKIASLGFPQQVAMQFADKILHHARKLS